MDNNETTSPPNFYAVIEAGIRYDNSLSNFAKVLYSEINALSNKNGYCFASNSYFEKVFEVSQQTVSSTITMLVEKGHIEVDNRSGTGTRKIVPNRTSKPVTPVQEKLLQNTTSNNTTSNNINNTSLLASFKLPVDGNSKLTRFCNFYSLLWKEKFGTFPSVTVPVVGRSLKAVLSEHSESQLGLLLVQYFKWHGMDGNDVNVHNNLLSNAFPIMWFGKYAPQMVAYLTNTTGIDLKDEEVVISTLNEVLEGT